MWKGPRASPFLVSAGLVVYDLLAFGSRPVQPHRHYRARQLLAAYPFVDREKLLGGFRYGDCQEDDARMTLTVVAAGQRAGVVRSEEHTSELQSLMRNSYAVFCLKQILSRSAMLNLKQTQIKR